MVEYFARALHVSNVTFYTLLFATLILGSLLLGFALSRVLHYAKKRVHEGHRQLVLALLESLPMPLLLIGSLYLGMESLPLPPKFEQIGSKVLLLLVTFVMVYFPAKVIVLALRRWGQQDAHMLRVTQPATFLVQTIFALIGTLIFLNKMGVSLTAVWGTLGVGSLAVALALQDTLSNFFSGLYLLADRPISPNDYIHLDPNAEGYVVQIGWRSTILRTLSNNYIIIPNAVLAKATLTNYSAPETRMSCAVTVGVTYGTDPAKVEKLLLEAAHEALREGVEGLLTTPEPGVSFSPGFGESALEFTLGMQIRQFTDQFSVQSNLRKRILKKFNEAGVVMPFPTRSIVFDESTKGLLREGSKN